MIKSVLKLLLLFCAVGLILFAYQAKGQVDIRWEQISISMKMGTFVAFVCVCVWVLFYVFAFVTYLGRLSKNLKQYWQNRHEIEGHRYIEEAISAQVGGMPELALKQRADPDC